MIDEENLRIQTKINLAEGEYKDLITSKDTIKRMIGVNFDSFIKLDDGKKIENIDNKI